MFRPVVIVPVYNHDRHLAALVDRLRAWALPCILIDDGSAADCARALDAIKACHPDRVTLVRHERNLGKGSAVMSGLARAYAQGFTHALQIDADGQHAIEELPLLLELSRAHPRALVAGQPRFDASVPRTRLYLRYLTHWMVSLNTLTPTLCDAMCGFRVYPVRSVLALARRTALGRRMDFDIEIFVRLHWAGVPIILHPTHVRYPADGVSHFRLWSDNVRIAILHTRLFFEMLAQAPRLYRRRRTIA